MEGGAAERVLFGRLRKPSNFFRLAVAAACLSVVPAVVLLREGGHGSTRRVDAERLFCARG